MLRSDCGGKYESPFFDFCGQHGVIYETTTPYSPQSNEVAERTLKENMNAMLISSVYHKTCGEKQFCLVITF